MVKGLQPQGAGFEASGDTEGAILAYLHTHLMFSLQPDAYAEALQRLVELWPTVGKPERRHKHAKSYSKDTQVLVRLS